VPRVGFFRNSKFAVANFGRVRSSRVSSVEETPLRFSNPTREQSSLLATGHK
jgi:hypothetical protein